MYWNLGGIFVCWNVNLDKLTLLILFNPSSPMYWNLGGIFECWNVILDKLTLPVNPIDHSYT